MPKAQVIIDGKLLPATRENLEKLWFAQHRAMVLRAGARVQAEEQIPSAPSQKSPIPPTRDIGAP